MNQLTQEDREEINRWIKAVNAQWVEVEGKRYIIKIKRRENANNR